VTSSEISAVFLDRDGTLNRTFVEGGVPRPPADLDRLEILPGVPEALARLKRAGFALVVVTNQPDIGNGFVARDVVEAMHHALYRRARVDAIEMCPHRQNEGCGCRKPKPGLLISAADRLAIDLRRSFLVGDRAQDILAGRAAGCYTVFVDRGYREPRPVEPDAVVRSLPAAVRRIIKVASTTTSRGGRR